MVEKAGPRSPSDPGGLWGGGTVLLHSNIDITTHCVVCVRLGIRRAEEEAGQLKQLVR